jgi:hypothetical protein
MLAHTSAWTLTVALLLSLAEERPAPDPELVHAEKVLRERNITPDGATLLRFFRARTLGEAERQRLAEKIDQLGAEDFAVREQATQTLINAGRLAVPFLKPAVDDRDPERARRARRCLEIVESRAEDAALIAAARVLADRQPDGAAEALLAFVPGADEEFVEAAMRDALVRLGLRDGKPLPVIVQALADADPSRRAAAAHVVGKAAPAERQPLRPLLRDTDVRVRFEAAAGLLRGGERAGLPVLIALLEEAPPALAWRSHDLLCHVAGEKSPPTPTGTTEKDRRQARAVWEEWAKRDGDKVDLSKVNFGETLLGLNLICEIEPADANSRVWECRADGVVRWEMKGVLAPCDAQVLPGGRLLIAEYQGQRVTERDRDGKILWEHKVTAYPTTCRRLPSGNTFIITYREILEVTPDHKVVWSLKNPVNGDIYRGQRLRNGNVLFLCAGGKIIEIETPSGKEVRRIDLPHNEGTWGSVEQLPGGGYLVGLYTHNKVLELDPTGKVRWEATVTSPTSVMRLPGGNALVASMEARRVVEIDPGGKEIWSQKTKERVFQVRRY